MGSEKQPVVRICEAAEISDEARALLQPEMAPQRYVEVLVESGQFPDAVRFVAHSLPKREAVWWAWFCARRSSGANPPAVIQACLSATEKWITQPNEENRRAAMKQPRRRRSEPRLDARVSERFSAAAAWRRPRPQSRRRANS